ncbi:MAG: TRAP transporter small permease [Marivibrio sp.]|uniref:TRAP transporter small permease n=1 Tax=Marivibrio sp. TaxID=2039719 RepID=UPI0032EBC5B9
MRRALDRLYEVSGLIAAFFLILICTVVTAQVVLNTIDRIAGLLTGSAIGLVIPSYSTFAGLFLAASTFFALPYAFRRGAHIRVSLVLQALPPTAQRGCDVAAALIATLFSAFFTWYMGGLVQESLQFGDVTSGIVPVPLWIPQSAMTLGLAILTIACLDDFLTLMRGGEAAFNEGGQQLLKQADEGEIPRDATDDGR